MKQEAEEIGQIVASEEQIRHADFLDALATSMNKKSKHPDVRKIVFNLREVARRIREGYALIQE